MTVLYFAALRELLGTSEERVTLPPGRQTVDGCARLLCERHPELLPHLASVRFALNETFVRGDAPVADGDTLALIPPVSGG